MAGRRSIATTTVDHRLLTAYAANAPVAPGGELRVRIPAHGNDLSIAVTWPALYPLPAVGEACLVALDERGNPWVVEWSRQTVAVPTLAALTAASACRMAAQTLAVGTQAIGLDTAISDPNSLFDLVHHRYVVPSTGLYQVNGQIATLLANNPQVNIVGFIRNGVTTTWLARGTRTCVRGGTTGDVWYLAASALIPLAIGDHLELAATNSGGGSTQALEIVELGANNYLSAFRVS